MLNFNFDLNEMQERAKELKGKNIVFKADTGTGKTEAILLAIEEGKKVAWFLPTISACIFMYRRLCNDFGSINVRIRTSLMSETREVPGALFSIDIMSPDMPLIDYLRATYYVDETYSPEYDVYVIDEVDSYTNKLRAALSMFIEEYSNIQFLIASATIDEQLEQSFKDFEIIEYKKDNQILYRIPENPYDWNEAIRRFYKKKKIVAILNTIVAIDSIVTQLENNFNIEFANNEDSRCLYLHSKMDVETRHLVEKKLFEGDYDILISNDIVSVSIDFDIDILLLEVSDKWNTNIQRLGRLNRRGRSIDFSNLWLDYGIRQAPFIDDEESEEIYFDLKEYKQITRKDVDSFKENMHSDICERMQLIEYVEDRMANELPIKLRDIGLTYKVPTIVDIINKRKGTKATKKSWDLIKVTNDVPCYVTDLSTTLGEGMPSNIIELNWGREYVIKNLRDLEGGIVEVERLDEDTPRYLSKQELKEKELLEQEQKVLDENYHLKSNNRKLEHKSGEIYAERWNLDIFGDFSIKYRTVLMEGYPVYPDDVPMYRSDIMKQIAFRSQEMGQINASLVANILEILDPNTENREKMYKVIDYSGKDASFQWSIYRYRHNKNKMKGQEGEYVTLGMYFKGLGKIEGRNLKIDITCSKDGYAHFVYKTHPVLNENKDILNHPENIILEKYAKEELQKLKYSLWGEGANFKEHSYELFKYTTEINFENKGDVRVYKNTSAHPVTEIPFLLRQEWLSNGRNISDTYFHFVEQNFKYLILLLWINIVSVYGKTWSDDIPDIGKPNQESFVPYKEGMISCDVEDIYYCHEVKLTHSDYKKLFDAMSKEDRFYGGFYYKDHLNPLTGQIKIKSELSTSTGEVTVHITSSNPYEKHSNSYEWKLIFENKTDYVKALYETEKEPKCYITANSRAKAKWNMYLNPRHISRVALDILRERGVQYTLSVYGL